MSRWGTEWFISEAAAVQYYRTQDVDKKGVQQKISEGDIIISANPPPCKPGARAQLHKTEGRWFITDAPPATAPAKKNIST